MSNTERDPIDELALEIVTKYLLNGKSLVELAQEYHSSASTLHRRIQSWLSEERFKIAERPTEETTPIVEINVSPEQLTGVEVTIKYALPNGASLGSIRATIQKVEEGIIYLDDARDMTLNVGTENVELNVSSALRFNIL